VVVFERSTQARFSPRRLLLCFEIVRLLKANPGRRNARFGAEVQCPVVAHLARATG